MVIHLLEAEVVASIHAKPTLPDQIVNCPIEVTRHWAIFLFLILDTSKWGSSIDEMDHIGKVQDLVELYFAQLVDRAFAADVVHCVFELGAVELNVLVWDHRFSRADYSQ
jgi:hypothetical protein